jgi:alkanesulfonate monooxygenase SsuD/methylene tetrahydromethanopterin reductase-like flavin-dependent oxidoreductase (luciferase family)
MKFGIFYELQLPRPWGEDAERSIFHESLDQIELADSLGYDYAWEVEHHFLEEYSHSSAPEVFLAAASQRTKSIRLGHGIVLVPPPFSHPARVAERIAALDIVSNGRVEFGSGESSSRMELEGFGVPREEKRAMWEESMRCIVGMFRDEAWEFHGKYIDFPARNVIPKPVQKPHPPLWVACTQRDTIRMAARNGIGALTFDFVDPNEAKLLVDDYYRLIREECTPLGDAINANLAVVAPFMCLPDDEQVEEITYHLKFFRHALLHYYAPDENHQPGESNVWEEYQRSPHPFIEMMGGRGCVGTPEFLRDKLRAYEDVGVDQVVFLAQAGQIRHEQIMESLKMFAREVMPEFKEREEQAWQRKRELLDQPV